MRYFADVYLVRCRRSECNLKVGHYHCPLCGSTRAKPYHIRLHLSTRHAAMPKSELELPSNVGTAEDFESSEQSALLPDGLAGGMLAEEGVYIKQEVMKEAEASPGSGAGTWDDGQSTDNATSDSLQQGPMPDLEGSRGGGTKTDIVAPAVSFDAETRNNTDADVEEVSAADFRMASSSLAVCCT